MSKYCPDCGTRYSGVYCPWCQEEAYIECEFAEEIDQIIKERREKGYTEPYLSEEWQEKVRNQQKRQEYLKEYYNLETGKLK